MTVLAFFNTTRPYCQKFSTRKRNQRQRVTESFDRTDALQHYPPCESMQSKIFHEKETSASVSLNRAFWLLLPSTVTKRDACGFVCLISVSAPRTEATQLGAVCRYCESESEEIFWSLACTLESRTVIEQHRASCRECENDQDETFQSSSAPAPLRLGKCTGLLVRPVSNRQGRCKTHSNRSQLGQVA